MTRRITNLVLTAGLSAMLGSVTLSAQDQSEVAEIPFAFHANTKTLPAGKYTVHMNTENKVIRLVNYEGRGMFVATQATNVSERIDPRLTFTCYGDECVLSSIWTSEGLGYKVAASSDKDLTRKLGISANVRSIHLARQ